MEKLKVGDFEIARTVFDVTCETCGRVNQLEVPYVKKIDPETLESSVIKESAAVIITVPCQGCDNRTPFCVQVGKDGPEEVTGD